jgi:hypothetical protein
MTDDDDGFGTDPEKLYRKDGKHTSAQAAHAVDTAQWERRVLEVVASYGTGPEGGCISDQVRGHYPEAPYSSITARFDSLEDKGLIARGPDTRVGKAGVQQLVMRAMVPEPDSDWCVRVRVKLDDGQVFIQAVNVRANNNMRVVHGRAKRKAVQVMVLSAEKMTGNVLE